MRSVGALMRSVPSLPPRPTWQTGWRQSVRLPLLVAAFLVSALHPEPTAAQQELPLVVSAGTHALTVPWYLGPVASGWNPAFMVGTDRSPRSGEKWSFYSGFNVGVFRHKWWMSGLSIEPELGLGGGIGGGLRADLRVGLGYMHYFWRRKVLVHEAGGYAEARDWGRPSLILPLSATIGYRGDPANPLPVAPFLTARWGIQGLFLPEVPIMTHFFLLGGVRVAEGRDPVEGGS